MNKRIATVKRKTAETDIELTLCLDGSGICRADTGIGFFDHMINGFARHGFFDVDLKVKGDLNVDTHHTVEDTGIVLGSAIAESLGGKEGIRRYGSFTLPMDDALVMCAVDLCGRPYFSSDIKFAGEKIGELDCCMVREFFYAVSYSAGMNLHFKQFDGINDHHIAEAAFKAFAKALDQAVGTDCRISDVLSTKGTL